MKYKDCDFSGWVTKNDLKCSDGRVIRGGAFAHQDGKKVPLVWMHNHNDPDLILGHTFLENRPEGVYGYSYLNDGDKSRSVKMALEHGDYDSYSIFANHLQESGKNVYHGDIKEVSLVLSGANPGACIENIALAHSEDGDEDFDFTEAIIYSGEPFMPNEYIKHSETDTDVETNETTVADNIRSLLGKATEEESDALKILIGAALTADEDDEDDEDDDSDYTEESDETNEETDIEHDDVNEENDEGDESPMKTNIFEGGAKSTVLSHSDFVEIKNRAKKEGSFKEAYHAYIEEKGFAHADDEGYDSGITYASGSQEYGFNDPDMLFPDYKALQNTPDWVKRDDSWVNEFWGKVHRVPFARIKSLYADITEDSARAKGYITKGSRKTEEVFKTMKRVTDPTTIYKKQKLDKQDIDDITDFDVVAWIRAEMRIMLNEEIARAALLGDGRSNSDPDKIDDTKIRPIYLDDDFYVIRYEVDPGNTPDERAKNFIRACVKARKTYKGSGNLTMFTTEDLLTDCLLLEDDIGHRLYKTEPELCSATRTSKISTVEVMEGVTNPNNDKPLAAILVNPKDYTVGANKGGKIDMFDDFDIDYNQFKYLLETRCSGALTKWKSAIVLEFRTSSNPSQA